MIVAAVQTIAGSDVRLNLSRAVALVAQAVAKGAQLIALPEYFAYHGPEETWAKIAQEGGAILAQMSALAARFRIYLLAGSALLPSGAEGKSIIMGPSKTRSCWAGISPPFWVKSRNSPTSRPNHSPEYGKLNH